MTDEFFKKHPSLKGKVLLNIPSGSVWFDFQDVDRTQTDNAILKAKFDRAIQLRRNRGDPSERARASMTPGLILALGTKEALDEFVKNEIKLIVEGDKQASIEANILERMRNELLGLGDEE